MKVKINIDGRELAVPEGMPVRKAAVKNGIYIPGICGHPYLPPVKTVNWADKIYWGGQEIIGDFQQETAVDIGNCNLCLVRIEGVNDLVRACETKVEDGMVVTTHSAEIEIARKKALAGLLAHHPHACLTCAQREGCSISQCSTNVPENERCCILLNRCELGKIVDYIGLSNHLTKALTIYAATDEQEELAEGLKSITSEMPVLEERYQRLLQLFSNNNVKGVEAFVQGRLPDMAG